MDRDPRGRGRPEEESLEDREVLGPEGVETANPSGAPEVVGQQRGEQVDRRQDGTVLEKERASYLEEEGLPATHDARTDEEVLLPRDVPAGSEEHGTTALEQRAGEPHAARLDQEEPDSPGAAPERAIAARLVEPEAGLDEPDVTADVTAAEERADRGPLAPEEAAVHFEDAEESAEEELGR